MDYQLEQLINGLAGRSHLVDSVMVGFAAWSEPAFIAIVAGWFVLALLARRRGQRDLSALALLASGVALAVNQVLGHLWDRPRPFAAHPGAVHLLLAHSADSSFPSDHVAAAVAISVVLVIAHRQLGALSLLASGVVGFARIYVGDHYPGDVLAGAAVGLGSAGLILRFGWARSAVSSAFDRIPLLRLQPAPQRPGNPAGCDLEEG